MILYDDDNNDAGDDDNDDNDDDDDDDYPENYWSAPRKAELFPNANTLHSKLCHQQI